MLPRERATGSKWTQLHCKLHHIIWPAQGGKMICLEIKDDLFCYHSNTWVTVPLYRGTNLKRRILRKLTQNASWNSNWKKRFPYLITTVIQQQRELPPSYRQALRSFSKPKRPKQKSVFESLRDASGVESRSQLIPECHPPDYLFNQKRDPTTPEWVTVTPFQSLRCY